MSTDNDKLVKCVKEEKHRFMYLTLDKVYEMIEEGVHSYKVRNDSGETFHYPKEYFVKMPMKEVESSTKLTMDEQAMLMAMGIAYEIYMLGEIEKEAKAGNTKDIISCTNNIKHAKQLIQKLNKI